MFKKILLILILLFSFFINNSFASDTPLKDKMESAKTELKTAQTDYDTSSSDTEAIYEQKLKKAQSDYDSAKTDYDNSAEAEGDIKSIGFKINVNDISPGMDVKGSNTTESVNYALGTIIQKMMMLLGSLALLIMTVGAGFIILHSGQDELLSKGKSIFMSGVYALVIALGSYYLIATIRFILYS